MFSKVGVEDLLLTFRGKVMKEKTGQFAFNVNLSNTQAKKTQ